MGPVYLETSLARSTTFCLARSLEKDELIIVE